MFGKENYRHINENLNRRFQEKGCLIAQHRGARCGNIVGNTLPAFKASFLLGADMVELDVSRSTDGTLYCFHDTTEELNLRIHTNIEQLSDRVIGELQQYNSIWEPSGSGVQRLEEVLAAFSNGELYNVDRSWGKLQETFALLKKYPHTLQQALMKAPAKAELLDRYEEEPTKFMFMPIIRKREDIDLALSYENINLVGFELLAKSEDDGMWQDELIEELHEKGYFVWYNAITLSGLEKHIKTAGHDDDRSIKEGFDEGWGVLIDKGIDVIQTDWPGLLSRYRDSRRNGG